MSNDFNYYNEEYSLEPQGFHNLGFTCYYNALLQSLLSCTSFVEEVLIYDYGDDQLLNLLKQLIIRLRELEKNPDLSQKDKSKFQMESNKLGPVSWKIMIKKIASISPDFAQFAVGQQCAAEGFSLFLQSVEKYQNIQNIFLHRRKNRLYCRECNNYFSEVNEMDNIFKVDVNESKEMIVEKTMNNYLLNQTELLDKNCLCSNCNIKSEKVKESRLVMIPEVLFIMSKKFKFENGRGKKIDTYTDFPSKLTFTSKKGTTLIYEPVAQIEHNGSLNSRHYYAICKRKNKWYCINDMNITLSNFKPTNNTYIVLYHIIKKT